MCCRMVLAQHSLYGKCYNSLSTSSIVNQPCITASIPYMEFSCRCHLTTGGITSLKLLPFGLWAPGKQEAVVLWMVVDQLFHVCLFSL